MDYRLIRDEQAFFSGYCGSDSPMPLHLASLWASLPSSLPLLPSLTFQLLSQENLPVGPWSCSPSWPIWAFGHGVVPQSAGSPVGVAFLRGPFVARPIAWGYSQRHLPPHLKR